MILGYIILDDLQMVRSSILNLRAFIYQLGEDTDECIDLKKKLIEILSDKENEIRIKFLNPHQYYFKIKD